MNILIWDEFGDVKFYIVPDAQDRALLVKCHNKYLNGAGNSTDDNDNLDKLYELMHAWQVLDTRGPFALEASTFFISGFIP